MPRRITTTAKARLDKLLTAKTVSSGGIIRRKKDHILRYMTVNDVADEIRSRGFRVAIIGEYVVIFCSPSPLVLFT